jgi:YaiO family outer membrane protein
MKPQLSASISPAGSICSLVLVLLGFASSSAHASEDPVNSVEIGVSQEDLDSRFSDWQDISLTASHKFAPRRVLYGEIRDAEHFSQHDKLLGIGYQHPTGDKSSVSVEASASPDHHFTPEWSLLGQFERQLGAGWGIQVGWRHSEYTSAATDLVTLTIERYWNSFRTAYSLYSGKPEGASSASSHRLAFDYFYFDRNSLGIALSGGKEVENVGRVITTDVSSIALYGRHWISSTWSIVFGLSRHEQGDLYVRKGVRLGVRHIF